VVSQPCGHLRHGVHPRGAVVLPHDKAGYRRETKHSDGSNDSAAPHGPSIQHEQGERVLAMIASTLASTAGRSMLARWLELEAGG
jgi:hypothetical protein